MKKDVYDTTTMLQYTDDNGNPCYLDEAGRFFYVDADGYAYYLDAEGYAYYLDENGNPYYLDENGNPYYLNEDGTVTYITAEEVAVEEEIAVEEELQDSTEELGMTQVIEAVTAEELKAAEDDEEDVVEPYPVKETVAPPPEAGGFFAGIADKFASMELMDKVLMFSAVAVACLLIVVVVAIFGGKKGGKTDKNTDTLTLATVGHQLDSIEVIGGKGKDAITAAINERLAALIGDDTEDPGKTGYEENDFLLDVKVAMDLTTIKKDLKVKFSNSNSEKLVGNVPFSVVVTTPSGATETWYDDDMDGVIYKKDIAAGNYSVVANAITDAKYSRYKIPTGAKTVSVKSEITYASVNVKNEIKEESEVDTKAEDTKVEVAVESTLKDTVTWVASTSVSETYIEVASNKITDPMKLVSSRLRFARLAEGGDPADPVVDPPAPTPATVSSITATKAKTTYNVGETVNDDDITVTASYSDGTTNTVTGATYSAVDTSTAGTKTMTVTYNEKTYDIAITVNALPATVTSIKATYSKGDITANVGTYSASDITVEATLSDGNKSTLTSGDYDITGTVDTTKVGSYDLTVTYKNNTSIKDTLTIKVVAAPLTVTELKFDKATIEVAKGTDYKEEDLKLTATMSDKSIKAVAYSDVKSTASWDKTFDKNTVGEYKLTVTYEGKTATTTVKVVEGVATVTLSESSKDMAVTNEVTITPTATVAGGTYTITAANENVAKAVVKDGKIIVTATGIGTAKITVNYKYKDASGTEKNATPVEFTANVVLKIDKTTSSLAVGGTDTITVTLADGTSQFVLANSDNTVSTSTADKNTTGAKITIKGVKSGTNNITVTTGKVSVTCKVTVGNGATITPAKTAETVYTGNKVDITASVANFIKGGKITAVSSDTAKATVTCGETKQDEKDATKASAVVSVTGVAAGSSTITLTYEVNGAKVTATITITVKQDPKTDKTSVLKDTDGNQLYVYENKKYRQAVYADYYTAGIKFYKKGPAKYTGWQTLNGKVYFYDANGKAVTGEQVIQGAKYNFASDGSLVVGSGASGIDVSKWNGTIDWTAVKNSGISYAIIRVGYRGSSAGSLIVDSKFETNIKGATKAGLKVGAYFFSQAVDEVEAVEEASAVIAELKGYTVSYPVFIDVESSGGRGDKIDKDTRTAVCKAFCETIKAAGYTPGIYSNKTWFDSKINTSDLTKYKIWLAQYASTPTYSGRYDLWQYKNDGKVTGISGNVDLNMSYLGY